MGPTFFCSLLAPCNTQQGHSDGRGVQRLACGGFAPQPRQQRPDRCRANAAARPCRARCPHGRGRGRRGRLLRLVAAGWRDGAVAAAGGAARGAGLGGRQLSAPPRQLLRNLGPHADRGNGRAAGRRCGCRRAARCLCPWPGRPQRRLDVARRAVWEAGARAGARVGLRMRAAAARSAANAPTERPHHPGRLSPRFAAYPLQSPARARPSAPAHLRARRHAAPPAAARRPAARRHPPPPAAPAAAAATAAAAPAGRRAPRSAAPRRAAAARGWPAPCAARRRRHSP
jgi:hypothetical protein